MMMTHRPENTTFAKKLSPIMLHLRLCPLTMKKKRISPALKKKKKKKRSSSGIKEISRRSFDASVKKSSTTAVTISSWDKSEFLGKGAYGSVYRATNRNGKDKTERAIKTAELSRASSLMDEGRILLRLQSPFVVRCFGDEIARDEVSDKNKQYNLVLEYCSGKSLADLMENSFGGFLSESDVKIVGRDILSGLTYVHDQGIIHCDIKPDNLLLSPTDRRLRPNGYLTKIGDFGLAMEKGSIEYGNGRGHQRGTTRYMAPELVTHGIVDYGVDVWALGCTVLEMLTGQAAWGEHYSRLRYDEDWVDLIGYTKFIPYIPDWLSENAQDFLSRCLERDVDKRWTSHSLKNHPFVKFVPSRSIWN